MIKKLALILTCFSGISFADIGFMSPPGLDARFSKKVDLSMMNVYNPVQLENSLKIAQRDGVKMLLDFGPTLNSSKDSNDITMTYSIVQGKPKKKSLTPLPKNKLRKLATNHKLDTVFSKYASILKKYKDNILAIYLADEPYLNGIKKNDLEKAALHTRILLNQNGLNNIKIGVIFAGAMFNSEYATLIDSNAGNYVSSIDDYYRKLKNNESLSDDDKRWLDTISTRRLTTYDAAGNIYTSGGIPAGFDFYSFDFYLSTLLMDHIQNDSIDWLAKKGLSDSCQQFRGKKVKEIRAGLSFFRNGPMKSTQNDIDNDKKILDKLYQCRMESILSLLNKQIAKTNPSGKVILISESSNNGLMEFDSAGNIKSTQPEKLIELRVLQEVKRGLDFYKNGKGAGSYGLIFFLFNNTFDKSIKLNIGGVSGMPSILDEIYKN